MDRRTFLVLGSVGAATLIAGCNGLPLSDKNEAKTARSDGGQEEPTTEDDNIVAEFSASGSTVTDEFSVENTSGITVEIGYSGQTEFNGYLQFPNVDSEDVLVAKTSRSFSGEFYFQPSENTLAIKVLIPNSKENVEWNITVKRDEINVTG